MSKTALITGITGQDGSYLAGLLLAKGYTVRGIKRRSSSFNTQRIDHLYVDPHETHPRFFLHYGDLTDATNLVRIVQETQPDEIYNLGALGWTRSIASGAGLDPTIEVKPPQMTPPNSATSNILLTSR